MAIVPMPDGPRVNPTMPQGEAAGLLKTGGDAVAKKAAAQAMEASNEFLRATNDAYERMSKARADAAMNDIQIQVNDLMNGDGGALHQTGTDVVERQDGPFVKHYDDEISKIIGDRIQNLDQYQRGLLTDRLKRYRADRQLELTNHMVKEADAYQKETAKTSGSIAAETITVNPSDIRSVEENAKTYEDAYRTIHRGEPEESSKKGIADGVSGAIVDGIKTLLANDNPEQAQAVLRHYRGNKLTAYDVLKVQPLIRDALQKKAAAATAAQAATQTVNSLSLESVVKSRLAPATGKDFDPKDFSKATNLVSDAGRSEWAPEAYVLGLDKAKEIVDKWTQDVFAAQERGDQAAVAKLQQQNPLEAALTPQQKVALARYRNTIEAIRSGDKDTIRMQVIEANPDLDPATVEKVTKTIFEQRQYANRVEREECNQRAAQVFTNLHAGTDIEDIPAAQMEGLSDTQRAGMAEYSRRRRLNSFTTDSTLFYSLAYDNEKLKNTEWADLYAMAGSFTPKDFDTLANRKVMLEQGGSTDDPTKTIAPAVKDALTRLGYTSSGKAENAVFSRMSRVLTDAVAAEYTKDMGKGWDDAKIRNVVAGKLKQQFTIVRNWWPDSENKIADFLTDGSLPTWNDNGLTAAMDSALKATGYPDPKSLDRNEFLISFLVNPDKPVPGEEAFLAAAPADYLARARKDWEEEHPHSEPDQHTLFVSTLMRMMSHDN